MQHTRVLMFFTPNTDTQQKRAVFVVHAAAALVTSAFRATPPCLLILAAALFTSLRLDIEHISFCQAISDERKNQSATLRLGKIR